MQTEYLSAVLSEMETGSLKTFSQVFFLSQTQDNDLWFRTYVMIRVGCVKEKSKVVPPTVCVPTARRMPPVRKPWSLPSSPLNQRSSRATKYWWNSLISRQSLSLFSTHSSLKKKIHFIFIWLQQFLVIACRIVSICAMRLWHVTS